MTLSPVFPLPNFLHTEILQQVSEECNYFHMEEVEKPLIMHNKMNEIPYYTSFHKTETACSFLHVPGSVSRRVEREQTMFRVPL